MNLRELYEAATSAVTQSEHGEYIMKFNADEVRAARSDWMKAAIDTDNARLFHGENSEEHLKARDIETVVHEKYLAAKDRAGILGKNNRE